MKINVPNEGNLIKIEDISIGECFKYWPNNNYRNHYSVCIRTNGGFCIEECKLYFPIRFVNLLNGEELGTNLGTLVQPLSLTVERTEIL